jgi:hypothetical protein
MTDIAKMIATLRRVARDGEDVLRMTACPKGDTCENCTRKWEAVAILRETADYLERMAVVH